LARGDQAKERSAESTARPVFLDIDSLIVENRKRAKPLSTEKMIQVICLGETAAGVRKIAKQYAVKFQVSEAQFIRYAGARR